MLYKEMQDMKEGAAFSRRFAKQQLLTTMAIVLSATLVFILTGVVAPGIDALGLAIAAATGFTIGVWCQPNVYRRQNGSLTLAIVLIAGMWAVPVIVILVSFFG
ncbi:hypothetical protein [uncultured Rubinisphaera sp.]|uniref:hypothetical protein n=1 Tax=uncultured Rubinisphaera sp. TaxID=1678686 RepID=UPI0030D8B1E3|tara:strand:+ start:213 stop:524 length:312 start_codon:yes stop_codon:yes gene_type:complete